MSTNRIMFCHERVFRRAEFTPAATGGATIAYREIDGGVEYAVALCSEKDHYNKKIGRQIARGRLEAKVPAFYGTVSSENLIGSGSLNQKYLSAILSQVKQKFM